MSNGNSLINLGDLTKPATVLIKRISAAIGAIFEPHQIKRIAHAQAEADRIAAHAQLDVSEIEHRGLQRLIHEEGRNQGNIEKITAEAIEHLEDSAIPENIEEDWLVNFFEKGKLIGDGEMQSLWAKILAGEANLPGTYARNTIELVSRLAKTDAQLFTKLMEFGFEIGTIYVPVIYFTGRKADAFYIDKGLTFVDLQHLDDLGLIRFSSSSGYVRKELPKEFWVKYYGRIVSVELKKDTNNSLELGNVLLTNTGQELAPICGSVGTESALEHTLVEWMNRECVLSSPWPQPVIS